MIKLYKQNISVIFLILLRKAAKNFGKKVLNNPGRALEIAAKIGTAAASKNPKFIAAIAPDIIKIDPQGKDLYLKKIH